MSAIVPLLLRDHVSSLLLVFQQMHLVRILRANNGRRRCRSCNAEEAAVQQARVAALTASGAAAQIALEQTAQQRDVLQGRLAAATVRHAAVWSLQGFCCTKQECVNGTAAHAEKHVLRTLLPRLLARLADSPADFLCLLAGSRGNGRGRKPSLVNLTCVQIRNRSRKPQRSSGTT